MGLFPPNRRHLQLSLENCVSKFRFSLSPDSLLTRGGAKITHRSICSSCLYHKGGFVSTGGTSWVRFKHFGHRGSTWGPFEV